VAVEIVVDRTEERALELTIRLGAREALDLHLVSQGVPDAERMTVARALASQIARAPREILIRTKAKIIRRAAIEFRTALDL
jgi:enoyl-CoA hydratase/carnithine racemase